MAATLPLPDELIHAIALTSGVLDPPDILNLACTSKSLHQTLLTHPYDIDLAKANAPPDFSFARNWLRATSLSLRTFAWPSLSRSAASHILLSVCSPSTSSSPHALSIASSLLAFYDVDVNVLGSFELFQMNPLSAAAASGSIPLTTSLLSHPEIYPGFEERLEPYTIRLSPLAEAAARGHADVLDVLLRDGRIRVGAYAQLALHNAVSFGVYAKGGKECIQLLLDHGADPKEGGMFTSSPLHAAAFFGRIDVLTILLDALPAEERAAWGEDNAENMVRAAAANIINLGGDRPNARLMAVIRFLLDEFDPLLATTDFMQSAACQFPDLVSTLLPHVPLTTLDAWEPALRVAARNNRAENILLLLASIPESFDLNSVLSRVLRGAIDYHCEDAALALASSPGFHPPPDLASLLATFPSSDAVPPVHAPRKRRSSCHPTIVPAPYRPPSHQSHTRTLSDPTLHYDL